MREKASTFFQQVERESKAFEVDPLFYRDGEKCHGGLTVELIIMHGLHRLSNFLQCSMCRLSI